LHCLEIVTRPCGCVIAWAKFPVSESPTNIIQMSTNLFPTADSHPTYIVVDKACRILGTLLSTGAADTWFATTQFLVDAFHFKNHKEEIRCQTFCNPAPTDGRHPNLITPIKGKDGKVVLQCAFNTEAAEQLNSWFQLYSSQLSHMHPNNHDFLVHVMLTYWHFNSNNATS
ncbi:uncharacterized protein EI90DRAFT_2939540, partial [Cantharellus anzutake]|uniref:uncharacterized protein n=1 Tax=Cantharellus anzutake TaxID=1750568 RepID=UPI001903A632